MKISTKLIAGFLTISLLVAFSGFVIGNIVSKTLKENMINQAKTQVATFINKQANNHLKKELFEEKDFEKINTLFLEYFDNVRTDDIIRIKVWDKNAMVIYSDDSAIIGKTFSDNEEFLEAIEGEIVVEIKPPEKAENVLEKGYGQLMEVYVPITFKDSNEIAGVIETYTKMDLLNAQIRKTQQEVGYIIFSTIIIVILTSIVFGLLLSRSISKPLTKLTDASFEIGKGNFDVKTEIKSKDEFRELSATFDKMAEDLKKSTKKSTISLNELDKNVKKKTKDLQSKNEEMEQFNRLAVERELKMVELKKKIKELEEKLQNK